MQPRGVCRRVLKPRVIWEGPLGKAAAANRTREIRPSGMRGGLCGNVIQGGTRILPCNRKSRVVLNLRLKIHAPHFYPTQPCAGSAGPACGGGLGELLGL